MFDYDKLVGSIYDCAANPELWPEALTQIRDAVGGAYALVGFVDTSQVLLGSAPFAARHNSAWDEDWLIKLEALLATLPDGGGMFDTGVDVAWTQLRASPEAEFQLGDFYKYWVKPQGLRDTINIPYVLRTQVTGMLSVPSFATRDPYGEKECKFIERISPHIRRAMMINDIIDKGEMQLALQRHILDSLTTPIYIVGLGGRLILTNAAGDKLLSESQMITLHNGKLSSIGSAYQVSAFEAAIEKASRGDQAVGIAGIGVPLIGSQGEKAAVYVLPISGKDLRSEIAHGHCVVFVARRGEQQPMVIEVLRTLFDLTASEARVASLVARGENPQTISTALGVTVNTVRTHLKHAFAKTQTHDQTALSGLINSLLPTL